MRLFNTSCLLTAVCLAVSPTLLTAQGNEAAETARAFRLGSEQQIVDDFTQLLRMPNVASDEVNIRRNASHIMGLMTARGFDMQLLEHPGSPPVVFGERKAAGADKTLMIYVHYDGQPVNASDWASDPWEPVMRDAMVEQGGQVIPMKAPFDPEWRIFGRSAGDDKAPIIALGAALDALDEAGISPSVNLKVFFEGEEEAGSPHLKGMLEKHRELLGADLWLFCDGPVHQSRSWQLVNGVRGSFGFDLTVYGPNRPLHSGHYGNWSPNPIVMLSELILSMRDSSGNIQVNGYMDPVRKPTLQEMEAIEAAPRMDESLQREQGIAAPETADRLELAIMRPAINIRGIRSGDVGEDARNAIQTEATASIGLRLVPDLTPDYAREAIERHVAAQGYKIIHKPATDADRQGDKPLAWLNWSEHGYPAYRSDFSHPMIQQIATIMDGLSDEPLVRMPGMGGSLPIYLIEEVTGTPVVILPIANHDNNQHGKDENLRLQNLWDAIEIYAAVITGL